MQFRVLVGDITKWPADAIVNSASSSLLGLSGAVDRAVHKAGGISLTAACRSLKGCRTGDAKITFGYKLPAKYVIHAVGPIWVGGKRGEEEELLSCYRKSLSLAEEKGVRHLAFTSVSTEDKRYPRQRAAAAVVPLLMEEGGRMERIDLVCADAEMQAVYTRAAVLFWLRHLNDAHKDELADMIEEAMISLVMLQVETDKPDPIAFAEQVRSMKRVLRPFLDMSQPRGIVDIEKAADTVMQSYQEQPEIKSSSGAAGNQEQLRPGVAAAVVLLSGSETL